MHDDMRYLIELDKIALRHRFRTPVPDETWNHYVNALADHIEPYDRAYAMEVRYGLAWTCAAA